MSEFVAKRNAFYAEQIIKNLGKRNMTGYYARDREEALRIALGLIPEGSSVGMGGTFSAEEIGLTEKIKTGNYRFLDRKTMDPVECKKATCDADVFITSANAISQDGVIINIDGNSNRVSAIAFGPKKVVMIVGMNKVAADTDAAMKRARNVAAPINAQRFGLSTPCARTGTCMDCLSPDTVCCQFLITRYSRHKDRIHVILVDDVLGF